MRHDVLKRAQLTMWMPPSDDIAICTSVISVENIAKGRGEPPRLYRRANSWRVARYETQKKKPSGSRQSAGRCSLHFYYTADELRKNSAKWASIVTGANLARPAAGIAPGQV